MINKNNKLIIMIKIFEINKLYLNSVIKNKIKINLKNCKIFKFFLKKNIYHN